MDAPVKKETRNTKQRNVIIEVLKENSDSHLTVEELAGYIKQKDDRIGIATIYRNLKLLEDQGYVEKVIVSDDIAPHYKLQEKTCSHSHHHLICQKCGKILDFEDDLLDAVEKIIEVTKGFTITDHRVVFYGICKECKEAEKADDA